MLCGILWHDCNAQEADSSVIQAEERIHSSKKAIIYSAILPGLGQIYNKKYWKVPIIYGAGGAFIYYAGYYHTQYKKFRDGYEYASSVEDPEPVLIDGRLYDKNDLQRGMNGFRRYRDLDVLGIGVIYLLNIIDAMVDAHFFYYDVSDDLSLRFEPVLMDELTLSAAFGLKFQLGF